MTSSPAAADTVEAYLRETGKKPGDFDRILTGDLGKVGKTIFCELMRRRGLPVDEVADDCGCMIFDSSQDTHSGASGCGCAATVFNCYILPQLQQGKLENVLLAATGALMSPTSSFQGENIPGISYAVHVRSEAK